VNASFVLDLIVWLTWALAGTSLLSIGAALAGRWKLGKRAARTAVGSVLAYPVLIVLAFGNVADADASSKATMLAKGLSEAMNCGALAVLAAIAAAVVWIAAARRERKQPTG